MYNFLYRVQKECEICGEEFVCDCYRESRQMQCSECRAETRRIVQAINRNRK